MDIAEVDEGVRIGGADPYRLPISLNRFALSAEPMQGIAEIEGGVGVIRRSRQRFIQRALRLREFAPVPICDAEVDAVRTDCGFKVRRGAQQFDGLSQLAHFAQNRAQIGHDAGVSGFQQQGLTVGRHCLRKLSAPLPADAEIVPGIEEVRLQSQSQFIGVDGFIPAAQRLVRLTQHELIARFIGVGCNGLLDESKRGIRVSVLQFQKAAAIERERVRRGVCEHLAVQAARLGKFACAVMRGRGFQQFFGCLNDELVRQCDIRAWQRLAFMFRFKAAAY